MVLTFKLTCQSHNFNTGIKLACPEAGGPHTWVVGTAPVLGHMITNSIAPLLKANAWIGVLLCKCAALAICKDQDRFLWHTLTRDDICEPHMLGPFFRISGGEVASSQPPTLATLTKANSWRHLCEHGRMA